MRKFKRRFQATGKYVDRGGRLFFIYFLKCNYLGHQVATPPSLHSRGKPPVDVFLPAFIALCGGSEGLLQHICGLMHDDREYA